ncbi:MAG: aldo/keto reductase [Blastocatellia bacterium]|nr:aldo/keto reductase [Blastocatellia bacterium]
MKYVNLGNTGTKVSRLCLGMMTYGAKSWRQWVLEESESRPFMQRALEAGINFYDTADMYSLGVSEEILGRALRDLGVKREHAVVATKVFNPMDDDPNGRGLSRKHIFHSIDHSLRRLQMDYIDLYQIHRLDPTTPVEEMLIALHDLVKMGKVLYIGASSMRAWEFARLLYLQDKLGLTRFVTMQNHYNLIYREEEREMIPLCRAEKVGLIPYSPLARGFVAGNRRKEDYGATLRSQTDDLSHRFYYQPSDFAVVERITSLAQQRGVPNAQIALAWVLAQSGITAPIIGASKMSHLDDALAALDLTLTADELQSLEDVYEPHLAQKL